MTLLDKSLKLALFASVALLSACPTTDEDKDTSDTDTDADTDADTDSDTDTDTDTDTDVDTGLALALFIGGFETAGGEYVDANFGFGYYGLAAEGYICESTGTLPYQGDAPAGCPDCAWSFDLGPTEASVATGTDCDDFGLSDGALDGYFDYSWGFSPVYNYDYNGELLPLENSVMLYIDGWFSFAFNYGGRYWVDGDETASTFARPIYSDGAPVYYYYYP
jgi:hypothetical protein